MKIERNIWVNNKAIGKLEFYTTDVEVHGKLAEFDPKHLNEVMSAISNILSLEIAFQLNNNNDDYLV